MAVLTQEITLRIELSRDEYSIVDAVKEPKLKSLLTFIILRMFIFYLVLFGSVVLVEALINSILSFDLISLVFCLIDKRLLLPV